MTSSFRTTDVVDFRVILNRFKSEAGGRGEREGIWAIVVFGGAIIMPRPQV